MSAPMAIEPPKTGDATPPAPPAPRRSIEISPLTMLVAAAIIGGLWVLVRLWPVLLVVSMALIVVGTLNPVVGALQRRGLRRGTAVALTFLTTAPVGCVTTGAGWPSRTFFPGR